MILHTLGRSVIVYGKSFHPSIHPLNAELNRIYHLLALLEVHHILHVSRI